MPEIIANKADIIDAVIEGVSRGTPLTQLCRGHGIGRSSWYRWLEDDAELAGHFARARVTGFDAIADRLRLTARGLDEDAGGESTKDVQRDKLIIETDLKLLAKWDPKRYGERQLLGNDPDNPLPGGISVTFRSAKPADDQDG